MAGAHMNPRIPGRWPARWKAPRRAPAMAACLLVALLAVPGPGPLAQPAETPFTPAAEESTARPLRLPESLRDPIELRWGIQFGAGFHNVTVKSDPLDTQFGEANPFSDGGSLHVDWLLGAFRVGYLRQVYRPEIKSGLMFEGQPLERVAFESDQLWGFHGVRPWRPLYLGYGLGVQRREITLTLREITLTPDDAVDSKRSFSETLAMAGLVLDYAFAPPLSLQIRAVWEEGGGFFQLTGQTVFLSYVAPY